MLMHSHSVSNCLRPHGLQPTRLLCPRDSPGKNTRVGCHFLSRGSSRPRNWTCVSFIGRWVLYHWASREASISLHIGPFPLHGSHVYWVDTTSCQCCNVSTLLRGVICGFRKSNCYLPQSKSSIIWTAHTSNLYTFLVYWLFPVCFKYYIGLSDI